MGQGTDKLRDTRSAESSKLKKKRYTGPTVLIKPSGMDEPVRPEGLSLAIRQELLRRFREQWQGSSEPVVADKTARPLVDINKLSPAERHARQMKGIDKTADWLWQWWEKYRTLHPSSFPAQSVAKFLDHASREVMMNLWKKGQTIPFDLIRRAMAARYQAAQQRRGERPVIVVSGNRAQRRKVAKEKKATVIKDAGNS